MLIRPATQADGLAIWSILEPIIRAGETYALPSDMTEAQALSYWMAPECDPFVLEDDGQVLGTYTMRPNRMGGGDHVCNCGYATAAAATGRGVGRAMCLHSLDHARARGFRAMQFNFVISTNQRAVRLWESMGFQTLANLPGAFRHPTHGYVDALVMFQTL